MQRANTELESSPLIDELKRRTEANKQKNAAIVRETLNFTNDGAADPSAKMKMVRYQVRGELAASLCAQRR